MKKGFSGSALKLIAIITMFIDHIGAVIVERAMLKFSNDYAVYERLATCDVILRSVGRIAFPIFCFLLVEGFLHTKNVWKYMLRLASFALISEIPFDLAQVGRMFNLQSQNIFFTLLIGLFIIHCLDRIWKQESWPKLSRVCLYIVGICIGLLAAEYLNTDYGARGIIAIIALYAFRFNRFNQAIAGVLAFSWEFPAPVAFLPVLAYNGKRGNGNKYLFYAFYPLHLIILYFAAVVLGLA